MKVKNLLFGTMIALAFTACSNENDPIDNGGSATTDGTTLEVSANFVNTKAGDVGYTVYVYNAAGALEVSGDVDTQLKITEGTKKFVVLDNDNAPASTASLDAICAAVNFGTNETVNGGTRNSCVYEVNCQRGKVNMAGYTSNEIAQVTNGLAINTNAEVFLASNNKIPVYRNVGLINLSSVTVAEKKASDVVVYSAPSITIDSIFVLNAHAQALRAPKTTGWWITTEVSSPANFVNGTSSTAYAAWWADASSHAKRYVQDAQASSAEATNLVVKSLAKTVATGTWTLTEDDAVRFVAFENTSEVNPTLFVIKGSFSYTANGKTVTEPNRYWTIQVGKSFTAATTWTNYADFGLATAGGFTGFRRNIQYNLSLTITGPGSKNPLYPGSDEDTYIMAAVQLVPYGQVNQSGSID